MGTVLYPFQINPIILLLLLLLLGFTTLFNVLGRQRRFRHRASKVRQILLRGSNIRLRFFTCRESATRGPAALLYFPSEGSDTQDFYALKKIHRPRPGSKPRTSDPEANMITPRPPGSTESF